MSLGSRTSAVLLAALLPGAALAMEPISISGVKVENKTSTVGRTKGNEYLRISFTATANESIGPRMTILVKGKAQVGEATRVDDIRALGAKLDELDRGQSKALTVPLFMGDGLVTRPESAELKFTLVRAMDKTGQTLADFCWTGRQVKEGPCEE